MAPRVMNLALQSITEAIALSSTWKLLRPAMPELLTKVVFPALCFDDEDAMLWRDDPQEYIRKARDDPRSRHVVISGNCVLQTNNCQPDVWHAN